MLTKTTIALLVAAAIFGAGPALAGGKDDPEHMGGFRIGPLGQVMGGPITWRGRPPSIYAYVPRAHLARRWYYEY
jgi:hypothetical protein